MMPLAGPRSLIGPTILKPGSLPKLFVRNCVMSCGPGVSAAIASCTASLTSAAFMPASSGFLCCQSKRSGKYAAAAARGADGAADRCAIVGTETAKIARTAASSAARFIMRALLYACGSIAFHPFMRARLRLIVVASGLAAAIVLPARLRGERSAETVTLDALLNRAAWYLDYFIDQFENVVAEEEYVQDASSSVPSYVPLTGRGS